MRTNKGVNVSKVADSIIMENRLKKLSANKERNAGVKKTCKGGNAFLQGNYEERKKLALACENLREDIIKLSYFAKPLKSAESVFKMTEDMNFDELLKLKKALEKETSETTVSQDSFITEDISENNDNYRI